MAVINEGGRNMSPEELVARTTPSTERTTTRSAPNARDVAKWQKAYDAADAGSLGATDSQTSQRSRATSSTNPGAWGPPDHVSRTTASNGPTPALLSPVRLYSEHSIPILAEDTAHEDVSSAIERRLERRVEAIQQELNVKHEFYTSNPAQWRYAEPSVVVELSNAYNDAKAELRRHRENRISELIDRSSSADRQSADAIRIATDLGVANDDFIAVGEAMSQGLAPAQANLPEYLFPTEYLSQHRAQTSLEVGNYLTVFGQENTTPAQALYRSQELRAGFTFNEHFHVYDNPNGDKLDDKAIEEDISELATGNYDRKQMIDRLIDRGVSPQEVDKVLADIELSAREIWTNERLRNDIDVANDSDKNHFDFEFRSGDTLTWVLNAGRETSDPKVAKFRADYLETSVSNDFPKPKDIADLLNGQTKLGLLTESEQRIAVNGALDSWFGEDAAYTVANVLDAYELMRNLDLPNEDTSAIRNIVGDVYVEHGLQMLSDSPDNSWVQDHSASLVRSGLMAMDEPARVQLIEELGETEFNLVSTDQATDSSAIQPVSEELSLSGAYLLVDALQLDDPSIYYGQSEAESMIQAIINNSKNGNGLSDGGKQFIVGAFQDLSREAYTGGTDNQLPQVMGNGLALVANPNDEILQQREGERLGGILATSQGRDLIANNDNIPQQARQQAWMMISSDPRWTADSMGRGPSGWENTHFMEEYSRELMQPQAELLGDDAQTMNLTQLENYVGLSLGLEPNDMGDLTDLELEKVANNDIPLFDGNDDAQALIKPIVDAVSNTNPDAQFYDVAGLNFVYSSGETGPRMLPMFRVEKEGETVAFVGDQGGTHSDIEDWWEDTDLKGGIVTYAENGHWNIEDDDVQLTTRVTENTVDTLLEHTQVWAHRGAVAAAVGTSAVIIFGSAGTGTFAVAGAAGLYLGTESATELAGRHDKGFSVSLTDPQARVLWLDMVANYTAGVGFTGKAISAPSLAQNNTIINRGSKFMLDIATAADYSSVANDGLSLASKWADLSAKQKLGLALNIALSGVEGTADLRALRQRMSTSSIGAGNAHATNGVEDQAWWGSDAEGPLRMNEQSVPNPRSNITTTDFTNVTSIHDLMARIPPEAERLPWEIVPGRAQQGIKWQWADTDNNQWRVHAHEMDPEAPTFLEGEPRLATNASQNWIYRVEIRPQSGGPWRTMDSTGTVHRPNVVSKENNRHYNEEIANDTHIPLPTGGGTQSRTVTEQALELPPANASVPIVASDDVLVGSDTRSMRPQALEIITSDPNHELRFLLDTTGTEFKKPITKHHWQLLAQPDIIEMGHITSKKSGEPERIMLQMAWENQRDSVTIESSHIGGWIDDQRAIDIGGIAVSKRSAEVWEAIGWLPEGTIDSAPVVSLG